MTLQELAASGRLELSSGVAAAPSNTADTCTTGSGRMLDYLAILASAQHLPIVYRGRFRGCRGGRQ
eukprot:1646640-Pyramimonas_sp.AAC.1